MEHIHVRVLSFWSRLVEHLSVRVLSSFLGATDSKSIPGEGDLAVAWVDGTERQKSIRVKLKDYSCRRLNIE